MKMIKTLVFVLNILLAFHCSKKNDSIDANNSTPKIEIDLNTNFQEMDGFGASDAWRCQNVGKNWPLEKREKIADLLFSLENDEDGNPSGIGLSIWRFNIGAGSAEQGAASNIGDAWRRAECFMNADGSFNWTKQSGQQWFLQAAKKRGVEKLLAFANSAPVYFTKNGKAYSPGGWKYNIQDGYMDKYADFLVEVAEHFNNSGLNFDYLSPFNEPQWDWEAKSGIAGQEGSPISNGETAELCRLLSDKIALKGLNCMITVGEAGHIGFLFETKDKDRGNQIQDFFSSGAVNYLGNKSNIAQLISGHSYFTVWPLSLLSSSRQDLWSKLQTTNKNLKYWQSEYCILEDANSDMDGGWNRDLTIKTALYVSRIIFYDLTVANASSWQWWTALTRFDYKDGLIYLDNGDNNGTRDADESYCLNDGIVRESKLLWAFGNFSRFVRPGMRRIKAIYSDGNDPYALMTLAFKDETNKKIVVVVINNGSSAKNLKIGFDDAELLNNELEAYETSAANNLKKTGIFKADAISIPEQSIVTLTGKYR